MTYFLGRVILFCLNVLPRLATLRKRQGYHTPGLIDLEVIRFVRAMAPIKETAVLGRNQISKLATSVNK